MRATVCAKWSRNGRRVGMCHLTAASKHAEGSHSTFPPFYCDSDTTNVRSSRFSTLHPVNIGLGKLGSWDDMVLYVLSPESSFQTKDSWFKDRGYKKVCWDLGGETQRYVQGADGLAETQHGGSGRYNNNNKSQAERRPTPLPLGKQKRKK